MNSLQLSFYSFPFYMRQNYTQKYNKLYDRTEFYNSYGNMKYIKK